MTIWLYANVITFILSIVFFWLAYKAGQGTMCSDSAYHMFIYGPIAILLLAIALISSITRWVYA